MTPLQIRTPDIEGVNSIDINRRHGLWSFGVDGGRGVVEFWDPRSKSALTKLLLPASSLLPMQPEFDGTGIAPPDQELSVTALKSHPIDGLSLAVGISTGHTLLYDLRSPTPFAIKDQGYGEPIRSVDWLRGAGVEDEGRVISADSKVIKIWGKSDVSAPSRWPGIPHCILDAITDPALTAHEQSFVVTSSFHSDRPPPRSQLRSPIYCVRCTSTQHVLYPRPWSRATVGWLLG